MTKHWRRRPGRPRQTWLRTIENDLPPLNLGLATAQRRAQNRIACPTLVETATSLTNSGWWWWWWWWWKKYRTIVIWSTLIVNWAQFPGLDKPSFMLVLQYIQKYSPYYQWRPRTEPTRIRTLPLQNSNQTKVLRTLTEPNPYHQKNRTEHEPKIWVLSHHCNKCFATRSMLGKHKSLKRTYKYFAIFRNSIKRSRSQILICIIAQI